MQEKKEIKKYKCREKIAILMATFNGGKYISEQIDSILSQTFTGWELFIHDDGSEDNTIEIIRKYQNRYPDKIHILAGQKTGGSKQNFLFLLASVEAKYYMFSDQDDVWLKSKIAKTFDHMQVLEKKSLNEPILVFTDLSVVNENLEMIDVKMSSYQSLKMDHTTFHQLMMQNIVTGCTMMINQKCAELSLKCKDINEMIMHDWWFALTASKFGIVSAVDEPLILYRQHSDNTVGAKNIHSKKYLEKRLKEKKDTKNSLFRTQKQAECFLVTYQIKDKAAEEYSQFPSYSKIKKLYILFKYHLWKNNLVRNLGLIWYC